MTQACAANLLSALADGVTGATRRQPAIVTTLSCDCHRREAQSGQSYACTGSSLRPSNDRRMRRTCRSHCGPGKRTRRGALCDRRARPAQRSACAGPHDDEPTRLLVEIPSRVRYVGRTRRKRTEVIPSGCSNSDIGLRPRARSRRSFAARDALRRCEQQRALQLALHVENAARCARPTSGSSRSKATPGGSRRRSRRPRARAARRGSSASRGHGSAETAGARGEIP